MVGRAERDVEMLEKDLEELRRRDEEISQLLQTEDNAHFLQVWRKRNNPRVKILRITENRQDKIYRRFLILLIWKSGILYLPPLLHISSSYITDPLHLMHPVRP